jgi:hypothetical protein
MPRQSTTRTSKTTRAATGGTRRSTTTTRRGNGPKAGNGPRNGTDRSNGPRNGRNNTPVYWPLELVDGNNAIDVLVDGSDSPRTLTGCIRCGAILLDTDTARKLHSKWHEVIDAVDQRAG